MGICCCCCNKEPERIHHRRDSSLSNISTKRYNLEEVMPPDYKLEDTPFLNMNPVLLESSSSTALAPAQVESIRRSSFLLLNHGKLPHALSANT